MKLYMTLGSIVMNMEISSFPLLHDRCVMSDVCGVTEIVKIFYCEYQTNKQKNHGYALLARAHSVCVGVCVRARACVFVYVCMYCMCVAYDAAI